MLRHLAAELAEFARAQLYTWLQVMTVEMSPDAVTFGLETETESDAEMIEHGAAELVHAFTGINRRGIVASAERIGVRHVEVTFQRGPVARVFDAATRAERIAVDAFGEAIG